LTKEAFIFFFNTHFDAVRNYIFYRSGNAELATDIAQETFMTIWEKKIDTDKKKIKGLLYKIAGNLFINQYRKQQTIFKFNNRFEVNNEEFSPENEFEFKELKEKYEQAISILPEKQRLVFLMSRYDGLKYHEIAENLSISIKTVEKRMSKTLTFMRQTLNT